MVGGLTLATFAVALKLLSPIRILCVVGVALALQGPNLTHQASDRDRLGLDGSLELGIALQKIYDELAALSKRSDCG
jgi:hypothetical protein